MTSIAAKESDSIPPSAGNGNGHVLTQGQPSPQSQAHRPSASPVPWRPSSFSGRNSPSPAASSPSTSRDNHDQATHHHPAHGASRLGNMSDRSKSHLGTSSSQPSSGSAWSSPSRKALATPERAHSGEHDISSFSSASPSGGGAGVSSASKISSITQSPSSSGGLGASSGTTSSHPPSQSQPLNMEALAARFADTKDKFSKLQLSPALAAPANFPDKERRNPIGGSFVPPSPPTTHKVQRTASLTHGHPSNPSMSPRISSSKLQPGHLAQSVDMRRTASHNNAFSAGLGVSVTSNQGQHDQGHHNSGYHGLNSSGGLVDGNANGSYGGISGGSSGLSPAGLGNSSPGLAPFSLSQMTRSPRRSSLNPSETSDSARHDHHTLAHSSIPSDKHPLQHSWTLFYDMTTGYGRQGPSHHNYENGLKELGTFTTVELFARYFNWIEKPHKLDFNGNYHLFKDGIKPMWEDPANANGGRWIVTFVDRNLELLDRCWFELSYALVGEQLDAGDDICGAVLQRRSKGDRLAVWVRDKDNVEAINGIGLRMVKFLDIYKENITMEFQVTKIGSTANNQISLDSIRKELSKEAEENLSAGAMLANNASGKIGSTPSLSAGSPTMTPVSLSTASPATPGISVLDMSVGKQTLPSEHELRHESENDAARSLTNSTSGLLISVDGRAV